MSTTSHGNKSKTHSHTEKNKFITKEKNTLTTCTRNWDNCLHIYQAHIFFYDFYRINGKLMNQATDDLRLRSSVNRQNYHLANEQTYTNANTKQITKEQSNNLWTIKQTKINKLIQIWIKIYIQRMILGLPKTISSFLDERKSEIKLSCCWMFKAMSKEILWF